MDLESFARNACTAFTRVAYIMLIVFGGEIISQYSHDQCFKEFDGGSWTTRDNINYFLGSSLLSYAFATMVFNKEKDEDESDLKKWMRRFFAFGTVVFACLSLFLIQFAIFKSHCETGIEEFDDDIEGLTTYGIILLILMIFHAIKSSDFLTERNEENKENDLQMGINGINWIVRFTFVIVLFIWVNHDSFINESLDSAQQNTSACKDIMQNGHDEFSWYGPISFVNFKEDKREMLVNGTNVNVTMDIPDGRNEKMYIPTIVALVTVCIEFCLKVLELTGIKIKLFKEDERTHRILTDIFRGYVNIFLAIVLFSLSMANDIAACPMFKHDETRTNNVFWIATIYVAIQFIIDSIRMLDIGKGGQIFPSSHMYEHFASSMY